MVLGPLTLHNFGKLILWELLHPVIILAKHFIVDVSEGSEYPSDFEYEYFEYFELYRGYQGCKYARFLNILLVLNMTRFWTYHGFKYAKVTKGSPYAWICPNNSWICMIIPECA